MDSITHVDILFVSNYSDSLNKTESKIALKLDKSISYKILTYRETGIKNSTSYESYIQENYDYILNYSTSKLQEEFKSVNFNLSIVAERMFCNYYSGNEKTMGHGKLKHSDMLFFIKSFSLFLKQYIINCTIVYSGYADNFMSLLTYQISNHYSKRCLTTNEINVVGFMNYLTQGIELKPLDMLTLRKDVKTVKELSEYLLNGDLLHEEDEISKNEHRKISKYQDPIFGIISPNLINIAYLKFIIFGYKVSDKRILIYMNIDKPNLIRKIKSTIYRSYFKALTQLILIKKYSYSIDKNDKYAYFPLQVQPESSTSVRAPYYANQLSVAENISKSLPLGYKLIVKIHPVSVGMISPSFFKKISSLPNVEFASNACTSKDLIRNCEFVVGYGGTTIYESILEGKKYLLLMNSYMYDDSELIFKIKNTTCNFFESITKVIDFNEDKVDKEKEKERILNYFYQRGFHLYKNYYKNVAKNLQKTLELLNEPH